MSVKLAIIYYSATATTYELARTMEEAAQAAGADVRFRKVPELAPEAAIKSNPAWAKHVANSHNITEASLDDLEWADAIVFGAPTRFGLPAAQLKQFIDTTGSLWAKGALVNKVVSSFTSAATHHGGQESTILALNNTFYHWGCIIVPPAYADPVQFASGTPYGTSFTSNNGELSPDDTTRNAARFQVTRLLEVAAKLVD